VVVRWSPFLTVRIGLDCFDLVVFVLLLVFGATCCTTYNAVRFQVPGCYRRRVQSEASVGFGFGTSVGSVSPDSLVCVYQIGSHDTRTTGLTCIDREIEIHRPTSLIHIGAVRTSTGGPRKGIRPIHPVDLTDQNTPSTASNKKAFNINLD
jgi:hypothetical protein